MAEAAMGVELAAIPTDDAGCFLTAVLQGMQSERGISPSVG
jgi:hypothetical protein